MKSITKQAAQYRLYIGQLTTPITITFWQNLKTGHISTEYSHGIKTPAQISVYCADQTASFALSDYDGRVSRLASIMAGFYDEAVAKGHEPSEDWIVAVR